MKKIIIWVILIIFLGFLLLFLISEVKGEVLIFNSVSYKPLFQTLKQNGFSEKEIAKIFSDKRIVLYPQILKKKGKGLDYFDPRFGLLAEESIARGKDAFIKEGSVLRKTKEIFGVPEEILVSLYRLETDFGRYLGDYLVFNSLLTFSILENRRSSWARQELVSLLLLSRQNGFDHLAIKGSWAGAFGLLQFLPSSFLNYALDGDGDGRVDLFVFPDAAFSAANYLKRHGWRRDYDIERNKKAIFSYNPCPNYVKAIVVYAKAIGFKES